MKRLLSLLALGLLLTVEAVAQLPSNWKMMDPSKMPESQVKAYAAKVNKAGYTLEDLLEKAEEKGANEKQLKALEKRFSKYVKRASSLEASAEESQAKPAATTVAPAPTTSGKPAVQYDTRVFGSNIFNRQGLTFSASDNVSVGESYRLGVGDRLLIDIYGDSEASYDVTVDRNGTILVPTAGAINVGGMQLEAAKGVIVSKLRGLYGSIGGRTQCAVRLASVRPVSVSVMGEVYLPGTYTVSATATLFNVLYLSGGPSTAGSMRDIQLLRGGKIVAHLDVYDFLIKGSGDCNPGLRDGDIVLVPPYQKRVKVGGPFKRSGWFEAKEGETVEDLINFAGGFGALAHSTHLGLFRIGTHNQEFIDVAKNHNLQLMNGDSLTVGSITDLRVDNAVSVIGAVFAEGDYQYEEGLTLGGLIRQAGGLKENAFLTRCVIQRLKDDYTLEVLSYDLRQLPDSSAIGGPGDLPLRNGDAITINSINEMRDQRLVTISGAIRQPGDYEWCDNMTLGDLIVLSHGLTEYASSRDVEILRRLPADSADVVANGAKSLATTLITRDLHIGDPGNDFRLEPYDQVFIRENSNARVGGSITLTGALRSTGTFGLTSNQTRLSSIIARCGGFTDLADVEGARVIRRVQLTDKEKQILLRKGINDWGDTLFYLRGDRNIYELVAINLEKALKTPGGKEDIFVLDGDELIVPERSLTVRVSGNVQSPTSLTYAGGAKAKHYIRQAGGFAQRSAKKNTYVIHANGQSEQCKHILWFRKYPEVTPGSEVVVPAKPVKVSNIGVLVPVIGSVLSMVGVLAVALINKN